MKGLPHLPAILYRMASRAACAADRCALLRQGPAIGCAGVFALTLAACGSDGCSMGCVQSAPTGPPFAYVATSNTLTRYSVDPATGALGAPEGTPLTLPDDNLPAGIVNIAADPTGQFLYVLDQTSGIHAFNIDPKIGALTAISGSPFSTPWLPSFFAFDSSGTRLYVAGLSGPMAPANTLIDAFSIDASGALVLSASSTLPQGDYPVAIAGNYLYVVDSDTNLVTPFSIGPSGELSQNSTGYPLETDAGNYGIAVDQSGSLLYEATYGSPATAETGSISAFLIDPSTGALNPAPGNPQLTGIQADIRLSIDPTGKFLLALQANGVSVYGIDSATGALSEVSGSPYAAGNEPLTMTFDQMNRTAYVINVASSNVSEFTLGETGELTPLAGSPVSIGGSLCCMVVVQ